MRRRELIMLVAGSTLAAAEASGLEPRPPGPEGLTQQDAARVEWSRKTLESYKFH